MTKGCLCLVEVDLSLEIATPQKKSPPPHKEMLMSRSNRHRVVHSGQSIGHAFRSPCISVVMHSGQCVPVSLCCGSNKGPKRSKFEPHLHQ